MSASKNAYETGRRIIFACLLGIVSSTNCVFCEKPNDVVLLSNHLGCGELGACAGGVICGAPTPRLDTLAKQGTRFTNLLPYVISVRNRGVFPLGGDERVKMDVDTPFLSPKEIDRIVQAPFKKRLESFKKT